MTSIEEAEATITKAAELGSMTAAELMVWGEKQPKLVTYETNIAAFNDSMNGGMYFPYFYIILGARGSGKTAASMQIADGLSHEFHTHFFSLEMGKRLLYERFRKTGCPDKMTIDFTSSTIDDIENGMRREAANGAKLFLIDSLLMIRNPGAGGKKEQLSDISIKLAHLKNELDVSVMLIAQVSKVEAKELGILTVKESGDVEYAADVIVQITQGNIEKPARDFRCTKNRINGIMKTKPSKFNTNTIKFSSPSGHYSQVEVIYE